MAPRKILIAGALGLVGRAAAEQFAKRRTSGEEPDLEVVGLSRRPPDFASAARFVSVDLRDRESVRRALAHDRDVTHLVYAALYEKPELVRGWFEADHIETNRSMLENLLDAVESTRLEHVTLLQGTKAYGAHLGRPIPLPARERRARAEHANFYFAQEDLLRERSDARDWSWTILRPQVVTGVAVGSAMNIAATLGAFAVLCRELGRPLVHPGHEHGLGECTDARLLARAVEWAAATPECAGEIYNITNGDVVAWRDWFPRIAAHFDVPLGEPQPLSLVREMPGHVDTWRKLAAREALRCEDLDALIGLSWQYADMIWANPSAQPRPALVSSIKARQHGFGHCVDSEDALIEVFELMQEQGYLPR